MQDIFPTILSWASAQKPFAIARVIRSWGSSPRQQGAALIVTEDMQMAGSVSGGCVETDVIRQILPLIRDGGTKRIAYGVTNEDAWAVGLSCGGKMEVFAERFWVFGDEAERALWEKLKQQQAKNRGSVLVTALAEEGSQSSLILPGGEVFGNPLSPQLKEDTLSCYAERRNQLLICDEKEYFIQIFPPRSRMFIIGAAHISANLISLAKLYDFEAIIIDPRGVFAQKTDFPMPPDQLLQAYPSEIFSDFSLDAYSYAVVLSHDPKIDDDALRILLRSDVAYIGALGSRKTHAKRVARLEEAGFGQEEIARIHAPIGVGIGAKTPKEIALSIMAEVIQVKNAFAT